MRKGGAVRRVLHVWDADYPWDVRVEKICRSLTDAGHEVHIAARNRARKVAVEDTPEARVHRMPVWHAVPARVDALLGFPAFCNPRWIRHLQSVTRRVQPDVIIVRDLPLCPTAVFVARRAGVPVVLDMAENYTAMIRDIWTAGRQGPLDWLVRNPRLVKAVEKWSVRNVDHIFVVIEESAARLRAEHGTAVERITLVSNTPGLDRLSTTPQRAHSAGDALDVIYLGIMEKPRGVLELIEACRQLLDRGVRVRVRLVGDGRDLELFRAHARELRLATDAVEFVGRIRSHADALALVAGADVGVVPYQASESWESTIPNKIFDYMAAGLPVVTSNAAPCARILRETGAGLSFAAGDAGALAAALQQLLAPEVRTAMGENGRRAIAERYHWERDAAALKHALQYVTTRTRADATMGLASR